jgi:L-alanine-DL-glutamate epimerase-like enolase superfamily enzyme
MNLTVRSEQWPVTGRFTTSRGSQTEAEVVVGTLEADGVTGRGEATPCGRYGESATKSVGELEVIASELRRGKNINELLAGMPAGATRNALDAACWDFCCKQSGQRITELLGLPKLQPVTTAYTISINTPEKMEASARDNAHRPLLKVKTGRDAVIASVEAVRRGAPESVLIVDANEAWPAEELADLLDAMAGLGVRLVEQPLPAGRDALLAKTRRPLPVVADESVHVASDIEALRDRYDGVNLKLDKTGGLTEALRARKIAGEHGMLFMCGCMLGTSLAMAPAMVLAQTADVVDLDAPLLLAGDRPDAIVYNDSEMRPYSSLLWG